MGRRGSSPRLGAEGSQARMRQARDRARLWVGVQAPEGCSVGCMDGSAWASGMAGKRCLFF